MIINPGSGTTSSTSPEPLYDNGPQKVNLGPRHYDVFNGDADGICALHQYRLVAPVKATLVTGVKRDIALLAKIEHVRGALITVFDISMHSNTDHLNRLLANGNEVVYIDHHFAGDIPESEALRHHIDPSPDQCASLIVNTLLEGQHYKWAVCGAFGDNLEKPATDLARRNRLSEKDTAKLKQIGELLNYNGYGAKLEDLYFSPDHLYEQVSEYPDPLVFYENSETLKVLKAGFDNDMDHALSQEVYLKHGQNRVFRFPDSPWARRVSGVFANLKARENPSGAHALITENRDGSLRVSVRAPYTAKNNADILCRSFPTGGGRSAAAGINSLPAEMLDSFIDEFKKIYS